jgi:hypothetical protein
VCEGMLSPCYLAGVRPEGPVRAEAVSAGAGVEREGLRCDAGWHCPRIHLPLDLLSGGLAVQGDADC